MHTNVHLIHALIIATIISSPLYSQDNNWEQRRQTIKKLIQQELEKGTQLKEISHQLNILSDSTIENKARLTASKYAYALQKEMRLNGCLDHILSCRCFPHCHCFTDKPTCNQLKKNYEKAVEEHDKRDKENRNSPEYIAYNAISHSWIIEIRYIPELLQKTQGIDEKIAWLSQEKQQLEKEIEEFSKKRQETVDAFLN